MSGGFIYPRRLAVSRPAAQSGVGSIGYGGASPVTETAIAQNLRASIQLRKETARPEGDLPSDAMKRTLWTVFIPARDARRGLIESRDILTDDLGQRYQVLAPYWNSLGYSLMAERLEV